MSIYKGRQKEGKIYKGGTKIGKVYKGSQLVYQSGPQIQLYGYTNSNYEVGMIGGMNTSHPYYFGLKGDSYNNVPATITAISGNLGASGSSVTLSNATSSGTTSRTVSYNKQITINGIKVYFYYVTNYYHYGYWIMEGSIIGSIAMPCFFTNTYAFGVPISCSSSSMTYYFANGQQTATRDSSKDKIWTLNGIV